MSRSLHSRASSNTLVGESYEMHDRKASDGSIYTAVSQNSTVGYIPHDYGERTLAYLGLIGALIVGTGLVAASVGLFLKFRSPTQSINPDFDSRGVEYLKISTLVRTGLDLALNILVTLCTEATGFAHSTTLRWSLAKRGKLRFNANLRLIRASGHILGPNGFVLNTIHAGLLTMSYAAASLVLVPLYQGQPDQQSISRRSASDISIITLSYIPIATLGIGFLAQAFLSMLAIWKTKIPTWSTNIFDVSAAALSNSYMHHFPDRCMRSLNDETSKTDPIMPSRIQPSTWQSKRTVRWIVLFLWLLPLLTFIWGSVVWLLLKFSPYYKAHTHGHATPSLIPNVDNTGTYTTTHLIIPLGDGSIVSWFYVIPTIAFFQCFLTMGLHFCEKVVIMIRDELAWRSAGSRQGARLRSNPLTNLFRSWRAFALFVIKPFLHWLFGNCISWQPRLGLIMFPIQIMYLCIALQLFAAFITLISRHTIKGGQPVTYGHLQTMINLVDDWTRSPDGRRVYWGHKGCGQDGVCHAGTSGSASDVTEVMMDAYYADSGFELPKRVTGSSGISQDDER